MDETKKLLQELVEGQKVISEAMQKHEEKFVNLDKQINELRQELMKTLINGNSSLRRELSKQIEEVEKRIDSLEVKVGKVDVKIELVEVRLNQRMDKVEGQIETMSGRMDEIEETLLDHLDNVESRVTNRIDQIGKHLAYVDDDTPSREEFGVLEKRVSVVEDKVARK